MYNIVKSKRKNKKYDVYLLNGKNINGQYLLSFGDSRFKQFYDKFEQYKHLNHYDEKRRELYRLRHKNDHIYDVSKPGFWSYHFLW